MCNLDLSRVGSHIGKSKTFLETCKNAKKQGFDSFQIFTGNTKSYNRKIPDPNDLTLTKEYLKENKLNMFIHSVYLINLGRPSDQIKPALECLRWELETGYKLGAKGVVVHVGKYLKGTEETAVQNMKDNIKILSKYIHPECPLLVETPAGQGTETLTLMEDFSKFIKDIQKEYPFKIGCCIDTCHVFASGYTASWYIEEIMKCNIYINLVHYNDSKTEQGSRKDRHAPPGLGHIGPDDMNLVKDLCLEHKIPMVIE